MDIEEIKDFAKAIRRTAVQLAYNTNTSHTGGTMSQADILAVLYSGVMNITPDTLNDPKRDRFIESKGHCCASYYAALALKGFMNYDELMEEYCKNGSQYFEHVSHKLPGVEVSTGSLGHGLPIACGMAIGAKRTHHNNSVYIIVGDGEINEGSNWESFMFAAQNKLDNLCVIIDKNKMQALGFTKDVLCLDPLADKLKAFQWNVLDIDGHDIGQLLDAFDNFKKTEGKPTVIIANTIKGKGVSYMENNLKFHYSAPNVEELKIALEELR
jgi:transketolase